MQLSWRPDLQPYIKLKEQCVYRLPTQRVKQLQHTVIEPTFRMPLWEMWNAVVFALEMAIPLSEEQRRQHAVEGKPPKPQLMM